MDKSANGVDKCRVPKKGIEEAWLVALKENYTMKKDKKDSGKILKEHIVERVEAHGDYYGVSLMELKTFLALKDNEFYEKEQKQIEALKAEQLPEAIKKDCANK